MSESKDSLIKNQVREFYDRVGWQQVSEGVYQNARYEDLRPVSAEYIQHCHQRVQRGLSPSGQYLLDAGSGPVQYPAYLEYSQGYAKRVCADISLTALLEARNRLGAHGWYVVCDLSQLPFRDEVFDGIVSLHAVHHVPYEQQPQAYKSLYRTLKPGRSAVVVNAWNHSALMSASKGLILFMEKVTGLARRMFTAPTPPPIEVTPPGERRAKSEPTGTYTKHYDADTLMAELARFGIPAELGSWRSLSVRFLRAVIHRRLGGRAFLRLVYRLEERYPLFFGRNGQYPRIVINKPEQEQA